MAEYIRNQMELLFAYHRQPFTCQVAPSAHGWAIVVNGILAPWYQSVIAKRMYQMGISLQAVNLIWQDGKTIVELVAL